MIVRFLSIAALSRCLYAWRIPSAISSTLRMSLIASAGSNRFPMPFRPLTRSRKNACVVASMMLDWHGCHLKHDYLGGRRDERIERGCLLDLGDLAPAGDHLLDLRLVGRVDLEPDVLATGLPRRDEARCR